MSTDRPESPARPDAAQPPTETVGRGALRALLVCDLALARGLAGPDDLAAVLELWDAVPKVTLHGDGPVSLGELPEGEFVLRLGVMRRGASVPGMRASSGTRMPPSKWLIFQPR